MALHNRNAVFAFVAFGGWLVGARLWGRHSCLCVPQSHGDGLYRGVDGKLADHFLALLLGRFGLYRDRDRNGFKRNRDVIGRS